MLLLVALALDATAPAEVDTEALVSLARVATEEDEEEEAATVLKPLKAALPVLVAAKPKASVVALALATAVAASSLPERKGSVLLLAAEEKISRTSVDCAA